MELYDLILRRVCPLGEREVDVAIRDGHIAAMGATLAGHGPEFDGGGHALIPGLADHHIHLLATAARMESVDLGNCTNEDQIVTALRNAAASRPAGSWVRAVNYQEAAAGLPDRHRLDQWLPAHPLRLQDRTGALWLLNSLAIDQIGAAPWPDCVECTAGVPTGRIWRGDAWLRERIGSTPPALAALGQELARLGITSVTDAGAHNGPAEAGLLAAAHARGDLPQRLMIMGRPDIPASPHYRIGPVKLLFDERDLPDVATVAARIAEARNQRRAVAAHCVSVAELLLFLAAREASGGSQRGDRIEHGSLIPASLIPDIAKAGLIVVTQPAFIHDRGDRYLATMDEEELPDLYRLRSLIEGGISLAAGSDSPYGSFDPWRAIRAAARRQTATGQIIGACEGLSPAQALTLYLGAAHAPGEPQRGIQVGDPADLCLLGASFEAMLNDPDGDVINAVLIGGRLIVEAG